MTSTHTPFKPRVKARVKKVDPTILPHNDSELKHGIGSREALTTDNDLVYEEIILNRIGPDRAVPTSLMTRTFDSTKPTVDSDQGRSIPLVRRQVPNEGIKKLSTYLPTGLRFSISGVIFS